MHSAESRVDSYIEGRASFAQPILRRIRELVRRHAPEAEEAIKWSSPAWTYHGKLLCSMAAFKEHATFGFWHGEAVTGGKGEGAMGSFGRLMSISDLPDEEAVAAMLNKAKALIEAGAKPPHMDGRGKHPRPQVAMTPALQAALDADPAARAAFDGFSPSHRREYMEWIAEAKRDETRDKRVAQAIEWLAQGKKRNWKYENC